MRLITAIMGFSLAMASSCSLEDKRRTNNPAVSSSPVASNAAPTDPVQGQNPPATEPAPEEDGLRTGEMGEVGVPIEIGSTPEEPAPGEPSNPDADLTALLAQVTQSCVEEGFPNEMGITDILQNRLDLSALDAEIEMISMVEQPIAGWQLVMSIEGESRSYLLSQDDCQISRY